ncbi:hypothetical protein NBRC116583_20430 [Arenicella sp. 4NH20-0111]|uniref:hypothetical protein n=1 Tax=Arenicella sp. 4NH20-0111 TaxID=3127648 RepID=UPI00310475EF
MMKKYFLILICLTVITFCLKADDSYISYAEFQVDGLSMRLVVDLARSEDYYLDDDFQIYKDVKFSVNRNEYFIGSLFDRRVQKYINGVFNDSLENTVPIITGGQGFYAEFGRSKWVVLNDGNTAHKGYPTYSRFYRVKDGIDTVKFEFIKELQGVAVVDIKEYKGRIFASGFKATGFYGAEIKDINNDGFALNEINDYRYLGNGNDHTWEK